jgi:thymidylate synthase
MFIKSTNDFEKIYQDMFQAIHQYGEWSTEKVRTKYIDGTPAKRKQIIGYQFKFDNSTDVVPLVRSRFIPTKDALREMQWIWIMQSNKVQDLRVLGCKYWNQWEKEDGTIGPAYGMQLAKSVFGHKNQLDYILHELKNNPDSTRILTELWNTSDIDNMSLTPCIHLTQWSVNNGKVHLEVRARSQDFALGLCSNVYQYSILHKKVCQQIGLPAGDMLYTIHNLHYYDRHEENLLKQFSVYNNEIKGSKLDVLSTAKLTKLDSIYDFVADKHVELITTNKELPKYKFEIAI